ncbi:MAG: ACT domain-containing protein [Lachnospiraceae bacterium]|jgi:ACT domain-containing protein|nr:ACT domain-containing protein [Lachnospiraceae bacterium]MBQ6311808.1 ACT domain-containing protein [Lachnospiraceae bacterium]MBQ6353714.1 ACT domain-containing protein [Lachnospiraceae bacterium]MBR2752295.1 ACT domain-containing protein [Lachnospiraceae bacterium]
MKRAVITVVGKDSVGIIASICTYLADRGINILDISQTIVDGYFNMMMVIDATSIDDQFASVSKDIKKLGRQLGMDIHCQKEEIFESMHRI